jgi:flagellar motor switch protein FliN/FliY
MAENQTAQENEQQTAGEENAKQAVQTAELSEATSQPTGSAQSGIDLLLGIMLPVTVTLGKTELPIQQVLQLAPGSVLRLDKPIEAPVELFVKNSKLATGSIVVVNGKFGVRIKEIFSVDGADITENAEQQA